MTGDYVLDCTIYDPADGLLCFCPVEYDEHGEVSAIVTGLNYLSTSPPDGARFVGVVHADGQDECDAWCSANQEIIARLIAERSVA